MKDLEKNSMPSKAHSIRQSDEQAVMAQTMAPVTTEVHWMLPDGEAQSEWVEFVERVPSPCPYCDPKWLRVICKGLGHKGAVLLARRDRQIVGVLPLVYMRHWLFGSHLVSLPFVNSSGVCAVDSEAASALVDRAVALADELDVRHLQLRHERELSHPRLTDALRTKVHMRLNMPGSQEELWKVIGSKTRNLVRKGESQGISVQWGSRELLDEFYTIFSENMRDLGTPVFGRRLFAEILTLGESTAELCIARLGGAAVAGALLVHHKGTTEVPSASCLRRFNYTNANMVMYWNLLLKAQSKGQEHFDFGRSTIDSNTQRFKAQWGAKPSPAIWQYYVRRGAIGDTRPDSSKFSAAIRTWSWLPVWLTRTIGPAIVKGIP
jgi:FemAB-related protein (PEP-CTERM system-associated)